MLCDHPDPMVKWRGAYSTEGEASALIEAAGGLVNLWAEGLGQVGVPEASDEPREGDVGIIAVSGENGRAANGGIFTGGRWSFLAPRGLCVLRVESSNVLKVWRP